MPSKTQKQTLNFIDVFSGAGGLSCGMEMAGWRCLLGVDLDKYAMQTFAHNHKYAQTFCDDIAKLSTKKLNELIGARPIHAVVGGPPCQGFSTVGPGNPKDMRNQLFLQFVRLVRITRPYFVVVENVTGLLAKKNESTLKAIFKKFKSLGYNMGVQVMEAQKYGVPEKRRRTILLGTRINEGPLFPRVSHDTIIANTYRPAVNVGQALSDLTTTSGELLNHDLDAASIKSKTDLERLKRIPEGRGIRYHKDEKEFLPPRLRLNVDWQKLPENRFRQTKYQRLDRNKPSPTIMTHRHSYYHPTEPRYLTQREAAKLQSFPNDFFFMGPVSAQWRQIGNAVPPLLGKAIGQSLLKMYRDYLKNEKALKAPAKRESVNSTISNWRKSAFVYREKGTQV